VAVQLAASQEGLSPMSEWVALPVLSYASENGAINKLDKKKIESAEMSSYVQ
jgi:hypothetical protein